MVMCKAWYTKSVKERKNTYFFINLGYFQHPQMLKFANITKWVYLTTSSLNAKLIVL